MHMAVRDLRALGLVVIASFQWLGRRYDSQLFMLALMFYKLQMSFCSFFLDNFYFIGIWTFGKSALSYIF